VSLGTEEGPSLASPSLASYKASSGKDSKGVAEEPSQQNVTYWEVYKELVHGEVMVTIEICYNDRAADMQMTTSHSAHKVRSERERERERLARPHPLTRSTTVPRLAKKDRGLHSKEVSSVPGGARP
jgi:hypothetical protein